MAWARPRSNCFRINGWRITSLKYRWNYCGWSDARNHTNGDWKLINVINDWSLAAAVAIVTSSSQTRVAVAIIDIVRCRNSIAISIASIHTINTMWSTFHSAWVACNWCKIIVTRSTWPLRDRDFMNRNNFESQLWQPTSESHISRVQV